MIPEAAVEAAAKALAWYSHSHHPSADDCWNRRTESSRELWLHEARLALEAAAPHMLAEARADAWQEGMSYALPGTPRGIETFDALRKSNPYR